MRVVMTHSPAARRNWLRNLSYSEALTSGYQSVVLKLDISDLRERQSPQRVAVGPRETWNRSESIVQINQFIAEIAEFWPRRGNEVSIDEQK